MRSLPYLAAVAGVAFACGLGPASAQAAAVAAKPSGHSLKFINEEKQGVTAIYAAHAGKNDFGDDLLGKQTAAPGRTVNLSFKDASAEACMVDLQMLMNDGKVVDKPAVNVCETVEYRFKQ